MGKKGKEPAGLRRWRLAQKRKKSSRSRASTAPTRSRKSMARRRYGKKRRKSSKQAVPIGQTAVFAVPIWESYEKYGFTKYTLSSSMRKITGYNPLDGSMNYETGIKNALVLLAMSTLGRKVANRTGANKFVKKITMGYLQLF